MSEQFKTIRIWASAYRQAKIAAAKLGVSLTQFVSEAITAYCKRKKLDGK